MSKPFLIIQLRPEDETADSEFDAIKRYGGLGDHEVVRLRAEQARRVDVDLDEFSAIIVGGSPFDVSTPPGDKSELQLGLEHSFRRLFDGIVDRDFPFLGCCSGNGLLGSYCGAPISDRYGEPVGSTEVSVTEAGRIDPLLEGLPSSFPVLLGHKEACDRVPQGATLLVTGDSCPVQMFRLQSNIYATQFHPEGDPEGFEVRINVYRGHGYFPPEQAVELIEAIRDAETPEAKQILKRFVDRYRD